LGKCIVGERLELISVETTLNNKPFFPYTDSNDLTGTIPSDIGNLDSLEYLYLGKCIVGKRLELISVETTLTINLSSPTDSNALTGSIPSQLMNLGDTLEFCDLRE
jgi:hypothetical protein